MTIQADVNDTPLSDDAAVAALIDQMKVAPKAPTDQSGVEDEEDPDLDDTEEDENDAEADEADADEDDEEEPDTDDEQDDAEDEPEAPAPAVTEPSDDAVVKLTVNGEETEVTVGSLKRLAGQEATLTRKSQEADQVGGRAAMMIQAALDTIVEDLEPYKDVDWLVAQTEMEPEEFKWHRENFTRNEGRYNALVKQAGEFEQTISARQKARIADQAKEATVELAADIPGWSDKLYGEIMTFAVAEGLPQADVANIANAKIIKLLHMAMQHKTATKVVAKKVNLTPARVKKPSGSDEVLSGPSPRAQRKLEQKMASGRATDDDAVALLMGRWKK